ncbi:hypothetical protein ACFV4P_23995 [Kitasatospora sp. NPDC059795]|uniref:hypothetical protein n=1 Tax=Kitasatospora sp. NPDC059795 TaxID=3346949 RepID=UPI00366539F2
MTADEEVLALWSADGLGVYASTASRHLGSEESDDGRPHIAVAAEMIGVAVARALRVPFHFASPGAPDGRAPRWVRPGAATC